MSKYLHHIPAVLLAVFLLMMGLQKFGAENIIFATIAERSGLGFFEPGIRILTGIAELGAAALLILPKTRLFGAMGAVAVIGGAIVFHLSPWLGVNVAMAPGAEPTMMLFMMALGSFVLSSAVLMLTYNKRKL